MKMINQTSGRLIFDCKKEKASVIRRLCQFQPVNLDDQGVIAVSFNIFILAFFL